MKQKNNLTKITLTVQWTLIFIYVGLIIFHSVDYHKKVDDINGVYLSNSSLISSYVIDKQIENNSKYIKNNMINYIYLRCNDTTNDLTYFKCINSYFNMYFTYNSSINYIQMMDYKNFTGNCETAVLWYKTLLGKRRIYNNSIYVNHHVFLLAEYSGGYCIMDQTRLYCVKLG